MNTVLEILRKTTDFFKKVGVPNPRLDAEYLIAHGLLMKRMDLYLNFDKPLSAKELDVLRPLVARRAKREPLQHIVGSTSFRGHEILCDKRALIPRPETEMLIDMVKEKRPNAEPIKIADIGTGTGAIAIALAKELENVQVFACDISEDALALARENVKLNMCDNTVQLYEGNLLEALPDAELPLDFLIANLPYIPESDKAKLQAEVLFDPPLALFGGSDGLVLIRELLNRTKGKLKSGATIFLEIASGQEILLEKESAMYSHLQFVQAHKDFYDAMRFVEFQVK